MTKATSIGWASATGLVLLALGGLLVLGLGRCSTEANIGGAMSVSSAPSGIAFGVPEDFLHGRITLFNGATHEGRLRFGMGEEALWGHYFNGSKEGNPWASHVSPERLAERRQVEIFGIELANWEGRIDLDRFFMARFGDLTRIEVQGSRVRVTLKSGTVFNLDRLAADDLADGVQVWDAQHGIVHLGERRVRSIELFPSSRPGPALPLLQGTVRTRQGEFTGLLQWNREKCLGSDELIGHTPDGELRLPFNTIHSIARHSAESSLVTLADGRRIVLSGSREAGRGNLGIYIDDRRYGRVLVSWNAFEHILFSSGERGPAYADFTPGRPLTGSVTTRSGDLLVGRLVYDLDESETTETLDAPSEGVTYTIPFGRIRRIVPPRYGEPGAGKASVVLHDGEELRLEPAGDLREGNAGMLIFSRDRENPEYVPWIDVTQIHLDRPPTGDLPESPR